jgi:hypothetical protein
MRSLPLFISPEIQNKEQYKGKHDHPVGLGKPHSDDLVNADNQKANGKGKKNDIR